MKKTYQIRATLVMLILVNWPAAAQLCSATDDRLLSSLESKDDFINYICPEGRQDCHGERILQKIEIQPIQLSPITSTSANKEATCIVAPITKGKQFPSLVFLSSTETVNLIAEDWDRGLKVIHEVRKGKFVLEGRTIPGPDELEVYRLEWRKGGYEEYMRRCYRIRTILGAKRVKLIRVECQ